MNIVFPSRCVRDRLHHLVALDTLIARLRGRPNVLMTSETLGVRSRRLCLVMDSKFLGMKCGSNTQRMIRCAHVTRLAIGRFVTRDAIGHQRQWKSGDATTVEHGTMAGHAVRTMRGVRESNLVKAFESGILRGRFSRRMTTEAFTCCDGSAEFRPNTGLGVTRGAFDVCRKPDICLMAKHAVGAKAAGGVDAGL
jgi:hypothetical protein